MEVLLLSRIDDNAFTVLTNTLTLPQLRQLRDEINSTLEQTSDVAPTRNLRVRGIGHVYSTGPNSTESARAKLMEQMEPLRATNTFVPQGYAPVAR